MTSDTELTARLIAGGGGGGAMMSDLIATRALVEEAAELGARRALARLGLADEAARDDVTELRELLKAWRDAKSTALRGVVGWIVRGCLALLVIGLAVKLGFAAQVLR